MSVQNLLNTQACGKNRRSSAGQSKPVGLSFQEQLVQTSAAVNGPPIHLRMPGENTVYSGVIWGQSANQEVYAEYTADSTPEEPIVRVTGVSDSGPYDVTCRVNSIDPSNASYVELAALYGHLVKTGAYQSVLEGPSKPGVLPYTVEYRGDITQKHDFIHDIRESLKNQHLPPPPPARKSCWHCIRPIPPAAGPPLEAPPPRTTAALRKTTFSPPCPTSSPPCWTRSI